MTTSRRYLYAGRGFTLVEMLVVIVIIAILAAILVPTVAMAIRRAKNTAIALELSELVQAVEAYKKDRSDYPPDFSNQRAVELHVRKAFPRNTRNVLAWLNNASGGFPDPRTLDAAEALVFWLSLTKKDPRDPLAIDLTMPPNPNYPVPYNTNGIAINQAGDPQTFIDFDEPRLVDLDNDGWPEYVSKHSRGAPYVYFDGRIQRMEVAGQSPACAYAWAVYPSPYTPASPPLAGLARNTALIPAQGSGAVRPYRSATGISASDTSTWPASAANDTKWVDAAKFQIINTGLDNAFGQDNVAGGELVFKKFPVPNYYAPGGPDRRADEDNIPSFSDGKTIGASMP